MYGRNRAILRGIVVLAVFVLVFHARNDHTSKSLRDLREASMTSFQSNLDAIEATADQPYYSDHLEYMPLTDLELESAGSERRCSVTGSMPDYCCVGSTSKGGTVLYDPDSCRSNHSNPVSERYRNQI